MRLLRKFVACLIGTLTAVVWPGLVSAQSARPTDPVLDLSVKITPAATTENVLTLNQALTLTLANSPWLRAASHEIEAAEGAVEQGAALPNPGIAYEMEDTRSLTRTNSLVLSQSLELGGKRAARIETAERGRDVATAQFSARRAELRAKVTNAFRDVLATQENLRLSDETQALAQRAMQAATRRVQAGSASPQEANKARLEEASARLAQKLAQAERTAASNRLAALWGEPQAHFSRVDGRLDELPTVPSVEALLARASRAPSSRIAEHELARREAMAKQEHSRRYPDVNVGMGVKRDAELGRNQAILNISLPLPLFDTNRGNVREAMARSEQARDDQRAALARLSADLLQARAQLYANRLEVESLAGDVLPSAQSALDAVAQGYALGKFGFIDLLDAQRSLTQVKAQHLRALIAAHKSASDIEQLLGDEAMPVSATPNTFTTAP